MDSKRIEVMQHIEPAVAAAIPELTKAEDDYWQPADLLPEMEKGDWARVVADLQQHSAALSDDLLVVLIGDMITEEALPSYSMWIAQLDAVDKMGEPRNAWGDWLRKWTSEENRHGDVLNKYLYLTGRVNMREVEVTIQNLLTDGADVGVGTDPYKAFTYTSFQEIATQVSHKNVAAQARRAGDERLGVMCAHIASDENRHAKAYKLFFEKILEVDPSEGVLSFYDMMRTKITMPAMYMRERGKQVGESFKHFAAVAERTAIYTPEDYTVILEHLLSHWNIADLKGLTDKAEAAQQYLCSLPDRYRKVAERFAGRVFPRDEYTFSWLELDRASPKPISVRS